MLVCLPCPSISQNLRREKCQPTSQSIQTSPSIGSALIVVNLPIVAYEIISAACVKPICFPSQCCPGGFHSIYRVWYSKCLDLTTAAGVCTKTHTDTHRHTHSLSVNLLIVCAPVADWPV